MEKIICPLIGDEIDEADCNENQAVAEEMLDDSEMKPQYRDCNNWRDVCKACPHHDF